MVKGIYPACTTTNSKDRTIVELMVTVMLHPINSFPHPPHLQAFARLGSKVTTLHRNGRPGHMQSTMGNHLRQVFSYPMSPMSTSTAKSDVDALDSGPCCGPVAHMFTTKLPTPCRLQQSWFVSTAVFTALALYSNRARRHPRRAALTGLTFGLLLWVNTTTNISLGSASPHQDNNFPMLLHGQKPVRRQSFSCPCSAILLVSRLGRTLLTNWTGCNLAWLSRLSSAGSNAYMAISHSPALRTHHFLVSIYVIPFVGRPWLPTCCFCCSQAGLPFSQAFQMSTNMPRGLRLCPVMHQISHRSF